MGISNMFQLLGLQVSQQAQTRNELAMGRGTPPVSIPECEPPHPQAKQTLRAWQGRPVT